MARGWPKGRRHTKEERNIGGIKKTEEKILREINKRDNLDIKYISRKLGLHQKQLYRILSRLRKYGYLTNSNSRNLKISELGKFLLDYIDNFCQ